MKGMTGNDLDPHTRGVTLGPAALTFPVSLLDTQYHSFPCPELCFQLLHQTREAPTEGEHCVCEMKGRFKMPALSVHGMHALGSESRRCRGLQVTKNTFDELIDTVMLPWLL